MGSTSHHSELSRREPNAQKAIDTVIDGQGAHYGDILEAVEAETGRRATYTIHFSSVEIGEWFGMLSEPRGMTHLGGGSVRFTNAYYRSRSKWSGVYVQGDVFYYDYGSYPLIAD
ncbi:hypothetical protein [Kitasatospora sp. GP82]|uniref:hypothetical protein n=1 Tax=Kitasatospora sp. GP82 TaxID=3035089 RepID=UPI00247514D4|nr:hypothetical protein [Kitasatospora sp. GP82]